MIYILKRYTALIVFGILQIFFSAPGQTFCIVFFVGPMFRSLDIPETVFAGLYSSATLLAALFLNPCGQLIDRLPVRRVLVMITTAMAVACWLLAGAHHMWMVALSFFLLRLLGQGAYGLTASTLIIKSFQRHRGAAMGLITLGFPLSELVFPALALALLHLGGWRFAYVVFGLLMVVIMLPVQLLLLRRVNFTEGELLPGESIDEPPLAKCTRTHQIKHFTAIQVLRDVKFYLLLLTAAIPPFIVTAILWHQEKIYHLHHWPFSYAALGLGTYAACKAAASVLIGPVVDRTGPLVPFIGMNLLLAIGTILLGWGGPPIIIFVSYSLVGMALGFSSPVLNVVWPAFYGTRHIGSIKGMIATVRNSVTGLGPLPVAVALDRGLPAGDVFATLGIVIAGIAWLPLLIWRIAAIQGPNTLPVNTT